MVGVAVVGYGYWGPNLVRNFLDVPGAEVVSICELSETARARARKHVPSVTCTSDYETVLNDDRVDAVVIVTPVSTHSSLALQAFDAGKHVLVSKPIARTSEEAKRMIEEARRRNLVLLVDHTFVYMGAVQKVRELVEAGDFGDLYYFDSVRINLGLFQPDVSVIWDLAVHDLSIVGAWIPQRPRAVSCIGVAHIDGQPKDQAYLTLLYDNQLVAHVHVNWLSPVKVRHTLLSGSEKMVVFDDLHALEKIKVYDRGITKREDLVGTGLVPLAYRRTGDVWSPQLDLTEALRVEAEHFVRCIVENETPRTGGDSGLRVVEILEAADRSMELNGQAVPLSAGN